MKNRKKMMLIVINESTIKTKTKIKQMNVEFQRTSKKFKSNLIRCQRSKKIVHNESKFDKFKKKKNLNRI